jgi:flavin reductase (DIM6/NTAB) family NADH-FMN oxidoreductase RutF
MSLTVDSPSIVDADRFRALLRHQASTVAVVTAPGTPPVGFTATSFTSVSLDPPLVSFCLGRTCCRSASRRSPRRSRPAASTGSPTRRRGGPDRTTYRCSTAPSR